WLKKRAEEIRARVSKLSQAGFGLDNEIDLRTEAGLGSDYETSTIAYKFYSRTVMPEDSGLKEDMAELLDVYAPLGVATFEGGEAMPISGTNTSHGAAPIKRFSDLFAASLRDHGISFGYRHDEVVRSFLSSLATKPFVILTGLSGSGKTQLALRL